MRFRFFDRLIFLVLFGETAAIQINTPDAKATTIAELLRDKAFIGPQRDYASS
jgi:hypothetical protein